MASNRLKHYLIQFPQKWDMDAGSVLKSAKLLSQAAEEAKSDILFKNLYKSLLRELKMSERTGQRLRKLSKDSRLYDPNVVTKLPGKWGTIEKLTFLSDAQFNSLMKEQKLKPSITRKEVELLLTGKSKTPKKDWSATEKLLTVRVNIDDPEIAQKILDEFQYTAEGLNNEFNGKVVEIEDFELSSKLEERSYKRMQREIERAAKKSLKAGQQICRYVARQMKKNAPKYLKEQVRRGQTVATWSMEENASPKDFDDLEHAFGELNVDISVEELKRDPEVGREYLKKLKETITF